MTFTTPIMAGVAVIVFTLLWAWCRALARESRRFHARRALIARLERLRWLDTHPFIPGVLPADCYTGRMISFGGRCRQCGADSDRRYNGLCPSCYR